MYRAATSKANVHFQNDRKTKISPEGRSRAHEVFQANLPQQVRRQEDENDYTPAWKGCGRHHGKGAGPVQKAKAEENELGEIHTHTTEFAFPLPEKTKPVNHVILRGMDAEKQGSAKKGNWSAKVDKK